MCEKKNGSSSWFLRGDLVVSWLGIVVFCVALHVQQTLEPLFTVSRADKTARARWIANLQLGADAVKPYSRLCSRHFPGGDPSKEPQLKPGKTFCLS